MLTEGGYHPTILLLKTVDILVSGSIEVFNTKPEYENSEDTFAGIKHFNNFVKEIKNKSTNENMKLYNLYEICQRSISL